MFTETLGKIARDRASYMRDLEYMKENVEDSEIMERVTVCENCNENGICYESDIMDAEESKELNRVIEEMHDESFIEEEIERIVESDSDNITLESAMGLEDNSALIEDAIEQLTEYVNEAS